MRQDTIKAICRRYPGHTILFHYARGVYVVVDGDFPKTCDEAGRDAAIQDAVKRGLPVLVVEEMTESPGTN
jgi:hypothetical protein